MAQLNNRQYKSSMTILFLIAIAFTAAMIGTVAAYWKQRVDTCHDVGYDNCPDRTHDYLFESYRNITNKFFVDCFQLAFNIIAFIAVGLAYQKAPRGLKYILVVIIFALSIWSLACSIKSIDEEDIEDAKVMAKKDVEVELKIQDALTLLAKTQATLADLQVKKPKLVAGIAQVQAGLALQPGNAVLTAQLTTLQGQLAQVEAGIVKCNNGIAEINAGVSTGREAQASLQRLHDKYQNYRKSVMALVLINFVSIYAITFISSFLTPYPDNLVEVVKLDQVVTTTNDQLIALKKAPSSQVEMNAQNAM